jgi:hypothetical protein
MRSLLPRLGDPRRTLFPAMAGAFLLAAAAGNGCAYSEGGSGMSLDEHTYVSTSWQPKTVSLIDTRTGQTFWSSDVPVGKQLVIRFKPDQGIKGTATPDRMLWEVMDAGTSFGHLDNSLAVPPSESRKLDMKLRSTPELPPDLAPPVSNHQPAPPASAPASPG